MIKVSEDLGVGSPERLLVRIVRGGTRWTEPAEDVVRRNKGLYGGRPGGRLEPGVLAEARRALAHGAENQ